MSKKKKSQFISVYTLDTFPLNGVLFCCACNYIHRGGITSVNLVSEAALLSPSRVLLSLLRSPALVPASLTPQRLNLVALTVPTGIFKGTIYFLSLLFPNSIKCLQCSNYIPMEKYVEKTQKKRKRGKMENCYYLKLT